LAKSAHLRNFRIVGYTADGAIVNTIFSLRAKRAAAWISRAHFAKITGSVGSPKNRGIHGSQNFTSGNRLLTPHGAERNK
jgi:hypothetical protein